METDFEDKLEECVSVVRITNEYWIKYKGDMFNHPDFWKDTLHGLDNEFWWNAVSVIKTIQEIEPGHIVPGTRSTYNDIERVLHKEGHVPRCLDRGKHKKLAFKALMILKDVLNSVGGYEQPTKFKPDPEPPTPFEQLFS